MRRRSALASVVRTAKSIKANPEISQRIFMKGSIRARMLALTHREAFGKFATEAMTVKIMRYCRYSEAPRSELSKASMFSSREFYRYACSTKSPENLYFAYPRMMCKWRPEYDLIAQTKRRHLRIPGSGCGRSSLKRLPEPFPIHCRGESQVAKASRLGLPVLRSMWTAWAPAVRENQT